MPQATAQSEKLSIGEFAGRIRRQYPGAYGELDDFELTQLVVRKYPQYAQSLAPMAPVEPSMGQVAREFGAGVLSGLRRTATDIAEGSGLSTIWDVGKELYTTATRPSDVFDRGLSGAMPVTTGLARGIAGLATEVASSMTPTGLANQLAAQATGEESFPAMRAAAAGISRPVTLTASGVIEGNPEKVREGLSEGLGALGSVYLGTQAGRARIGATADTASEVAQAAGQSVQRAGRRVQGLLHGTPIDDLTEALRPAATFRRWADDAPMALKDVKAAESALGHPVQNLNDFDDALSIARRQVRGEYESMLGPQAARGISGQPIADAMRHSLSAQARLESPALVERIDRLAKAYERTFTVGELDDFLQSTNARLKSYYAQYPTNQRAAVAGNPRTAYVVRQAEAIRDTLYKALDSESAGGVPRSIQRRYGALMVMEDAVDRARNAISRGRIPGGGRPGLAQTLSVPAGASVGAAVGGATGGPVGAGLGGAAGGMVGRRVGRMIPRADMTDDLVRRAMRRTTTEASAPPAGFSPSGLIAERAGGPFAVPGDLGQAVETAVPWVGRETAMAAFRPGVRVQGVMVEGPSGEIFYMPAPVRALLPERATPPVSGLLPAHAGGPRVTPLPKMSMREYAEMLSRAADITR